MHRLAGHDEWPVSKVQETVASLHDEWRVSARTDVRRQNLSDCRQSGRLIRENEGAISVHSGCLARTPYEWLVRLLGQVTVLILRKMTKWRPPMFDVGHADQ